MLALTFANEKDYDLIQEDDLFNLIDLVEFSVGKPLNLEVVHSDGSNHNIICDHSYNAGQIEWFKKGSALNLIKKQDK
jgi:aconitate hydratase